MTDSELSLIEHQISDTLRASRYPLDDEEIARLSQFGALLLLQNRVMNLTAITQPQDVARFHMLDCANLIKCGNLMEGTLLDVGSGAGFPGIVLKILSPQLQITLLDSLQKRTAWLTHVSRTLSLDGISVYHGRAEELAHSPAMREKFDTVTARAVADLSILCELCLPFVKVGGRFLAMKGRNYDEEIEDAAQAVEQLGGIFLRSLSYTIPDTDVEHHIILIEKIRKTDERFPRRFSQMKKKPL